MTQFTTAVLLVSASLSANATGCFADGELIQTDSTLNELNDTLKNAQAVPYFEDGKPAGYKKIEVTPGSVYENLRLKNGEVIKTINGEEVTDPQKAFQLLNDLKSEKQNLNSDTSAEPANDPTNRSSD